MGRRNGRVPEGKVEVSRGRATKFFRRTFHRHRTVTNGRGRAVMATRNAVFGGKRDSYRDRKRKKEKEKTAESPVKTTVRTILVSFFFFFFLFFI